jgi:hypothetical protein
MKLTYRGVSYDYTPNPAPKLGPAYDMGTYRGAPITFHAMAELPAQPGADLTWRGVPYRSGIEATVTEPTPATAASAAPMAGSTAPIEQDAAATVAPQPALGVTELARNLFIRRHQRSRKREQGMMVRLASEVGLPVDEAAHYESHIQGKMPHDFSGYDRSSTAMS